MRRFLILIGLACLFFVGPHSVRAHTATISDPFAMTLGDAEYVGHTDQDPWKGFLHLTVINTGTEDWGDFHFQISDPTNGEVVFKEEEVPTMTGVSSYSYEFTNGGLGLNFLFYTDPFQTNDSVGFSIYTDNTAQGLSFFQVAMNATPVPISGAILFLGYGLLAIFGSRKGFKKKQPQIPLFDPKRTGGQMTACSLS